MQMTTGILHELLRHRCYQCFGDLALQTSMLKCHRILDSLRESGLRLIRPQMERRSIQPEVGLFGEEILREGDAFEESIREECPEKLQGVKYPVEKRPWRNVRTPCRITSLYVQR